MSTAVEKIRLEELGKDLSAREGNEETLFDRPEELARLHGALQTDRVLPVLVGESGVGKSALVASLARSMGLPRRRIVQVTSAEMVSDALFANHLEHKVRKVIEACSRESAILFLDDLPAFLGAGSSSSDPDGDVAGLLSPYLRQGRLRIIGATTPEGWGQIAQRRPSFARLLTPLTLDEPPRATSMAILATRAKDLERKKGLLVAREGLEELMDLADRLYPWKRFPGKASELMEAALAMGSPAARLEVGHVTRVLGRAEVAEAVRTVTGLPAFLLNPRTPLRREAITAFFRTQVRGQDHVVEPLASRIQMIKTRMCAPGRPLGAYLLAGPTGVGKTLMARTLARLLLGDERRLTRFDMSEFASPDSIGRFVGQSRRNAHGQGLVDVALSTPFPIILLDEIEKAHRVVFDTLLQVLGEGRLTDELGRTAWFTNALILMTSNLGSERKVIEVPPRADGGAARVSEAVRQTFRPEFVNRLTAIFAFAPLKLEDVRSVAELQLRALVERHGLRSRGITLRLSARTLDAIIGAGYSPEYGVRPMERAVDELVGAPVAEFLAEHPGEREAALLLDVDSHTRRTAVQLTTKGGVR